MFIPLPFYNPMDALPGLELNSLLEYLFKFFICSIRLSAFFISSPFFGSRVIPLNVKILFSLIVSFFYFGYLSDIQISEQILENLFIIIVVEALIGLSLGLTLSIWFAAASLAGEKIASTTGLGFSQMVDPDTGGQTPVISLIMDLFLITIFLSLNGHLIAIEFLFKSFEIFNIISGLPPIEL